ncbi:MAG: hypothetical protein HYY04_05580 [Chloroflexi bacterium]|nr:hypothetical protein [Chloroflexota bacterium]
MALPRSRPRLARDLLVEIAGWTDRPAAVAARRLIGQARRPATWSALAMGRLALEVAIILGLAVLPWLFFWRLLTDVAADAATFPAGDVTELHLPYRRFFAVELALGRIPLWNPFVSSGHSAVGDIQTALFYPVGLLMAELAGPGFSTRSLAAYVAVHFTIAVVGTYLLGRRLLRQRASAALAAIVFTFGGYLASFPVEQVVILQTAVWLPWILLFLDLGIASASVALALPAALALAAAALAGHPQTLLYIVGASLGYGMFRGWQRGRWGLLAPLITAAVIGLGLALAAGQLLPALAHLQLTDRTEASYEFTRSGFAFRELLGIVFPERFGGMPLYHGLLTLMLVALAVATGSRSRVSQYWIVLGIAALLVSFGASLFIQQPLYLALGSFKLRDHQRIAVLYALAIAMLAGRGLDVALDREGMSRSALGLIVRFRWALVSAAAFLALFLYGTVAAPGDVRGAFFPLADRAGFTLLVVALGIGWLELARRRARCLLGGLAILLVILDLFSTTSGLHVRPGRGEALGPEGNVLATLQHRTFGLFRIASDGVLPGDGNAGAYYRLPDIVGNSPLEYHAYRLFQREVVAGLRQWQLLNVRYVVTKRDFGQDGRFRQLAADGEVRLYELTADQRLPRAWVVHRALYADNTEEARRLVNTIDPAHEVVITGHRLALPPQPPAQPAAVAIAHYEADALELVVQSDTAGVLVVSELAYPGWVAWLDGQPTPIYEADGILRGISVPPGEHRVAMRFQPPALARGREVAALAADIGRGLIFAEIAFRALGLAATLALIQLRRRAAATGNHAPRLPATNGSPAGRLGAGAGTAAGG